MRNIRVSYLKRIIIKFKSLIDFNEPKENTAVQRCWQYKQDPAIQAVEKTKNSSSVIKTKDYSNLIQANNLPNVNRANNPTVSITNENECKQPINLPSINEPTNPNSMALNNDLNSNTNSQALLREKYFQLGKKENPCLKDKIIENYHMNSKTFLIFEEMKEKNKKNLYYKNSDINKHTVKPYNLRAYPWELPQQKLIINNISKV